MVIRVTGQNLGQRTFSRAIWTHERVHFAPWDAQSSEGTTTVESALMLSEKNQVTIVCQKAYFDRLTPLNNKSIEKAMLRGRINVFFRADLKSIEEKTVTIISDSETIKINNDLVYIFAGGESTTEFLDRTGVCIEAVYSEELIYQ